jgi:hypothetical protein
MTCRSFGGAIVCGPSNDRLRKLYVRCPMCECITEMVWRDSGWYGDDMMCCRCGDSWCDGELIPRPFARGWRDRAVREHRRLWDLAAHGPGPSHVDLFGPADEDVR